MNSPFSHSPLVIRADASPEMGTGHVMRMLALGQANRRRGGKTLFLTASCPPSVEERILAEGFQHRTIKSSTPGDLQDCAHTLEICRELACPWLVLDGYHFREDYQKTSRDAGVKVACVDDYGHCERWQCDLLLNQNLGSEHREEPQEGLLQLRGTRYALLREEFLERTGNAPFAAPIHRLLITMGGSDPNNATEWVLRELDQLDLSLAEVRVIIGGANIHRDQLMALPLSFPVTWRHAVADMPAEYAWTDGVISAGGSTCWEWLSFGLPGAVVTIAENQEPVSRELQLQKLALSLGHPGEHVPTDSLGQWLRNPKSMIDEAKVRSAIDGRGSDRVMAALDGSGCLIRRLDPVADARFTHELANSPSVRSAGFSTGVIDWETHCTWLQRHSASDSSHLYIIENLSGESMGMLRFHQGEDLSHWEIGISLSEEARGNGYAHKAVSLGMKELILRFGVTRFLATIRTTNLDSQRLFERLGFQRQSQSEDRESWTLSTP